MKKGTKRRAMWVVTVPRSMQWLLAPVRRVARERFGGNVAALVREALCSYLGADDAEVKRKHAAWTEMQEGG